MIPTILAWLIALPPLAGLSIYVAEVLAGLKSLSPAHVADRLRSVAVLIPAHDEAAGIAETIARLKTELGAVPDGRFLVVADNCSDRTAEYARDAGAVVVERFHRDQRGKGYALAYGREVLAADPPDVVVVLDADCAFLPGGLAQLAAVAATGVPAQAVNLIEPRRDASPLVQISSFALLVKNLVRGRGTSRLSGAALLTGTGMAFPWAIFANAPLGGSDIVEDLGLGLALIKTGHRPRLVERAEVRSAPAALSEAKSQRSRWEHGFLATALRLAPSMIGGGIVRRSRVELGLGAHLLVPPLSLLFVIAGVALLATAGLAMTGGSPLPASFLVAAFGVAIVVTLLAWAREGRAWLSGAALLRAPFYVLWKLPLYAKFLVAPETRWVRTRREEKPSSTQPGSISQEDNEGVGPNTATTEEGEAAPNPSQTDPGKGRSSA